MGEVQPAPDPGGDAGRRSAGGASSRAACSGGGWSDRQRAWRGRGRGSWKGLSNRPFTLMIESISGCTTAESKLTRAPEHRPSTVMVSMPFSRRCAITSPRSSAAVGAYVSFSSRPGRTGLSPRPLRSRRRTYRPRTASSRGELDLRLARADGAGDAVVEGHDRSRRRRVRRARSRSRTGWRDRSGRPGGLPAGRHCDQSLRTDTTDEPAADRRPAAHGPWSRS